MKGSLSHLLVLSLVAALATGCHKKPVAAAGPTPAVAPKTAAADATPSKGTPAAPGAEAKADLALVNPDYEAWFRKYHLDLNDPSMLDADPDGDGYTNREEFLANTDPLDATSHPNSHAESGAGMHASIRLKEYSQVDEPFILKSVQGDTAMIERRDDGAAKVEEVKSGQTLRGSALRVEKVQSRRDDHDKDGNAIDSSRVTLRNPATKKELILVKDLPTRSPLTSAVLSSLDGRTTLTVRRGETFTWPGPQGGSYRVIELGPDQAILQDAASGKVWTIPKN